MRTRGISALLGVLACATGLGSCLPDETLIEPVVGVNAYDDGRTRRGEQVFTATGVPSP